ncbi:MAG: DUF285 domain-containing protein [Flammeovirgaceae bacterium]|nr:DUF285 domain-containing protein [Flammeovirgaceae bacterium]
MKKFVLLIGLCLFIFTCSKGDDNTPVVPQKFTVSVSASDGGSVSTSGGEYNENTSVSITATPQQGYEFSGWSGTTLTGSSINVKVTSNQTINANFTRSIYTLTIGSVGVGEVTQQLINSGRGEDYESGKTIRLTATPASEFLFYNWEQLNNNLSEYTYENPLEVIMDSSKTVTATFEERLPIVNPDNTDKNNTVGKWKIRKNRPGSQRLLSARAVDCKVNEIIFRSDNSFTIITETSTITGQYTIDSETSISLNQGGTTIGRLSDIILTESFISFNIELTDVCDEQLDADKDPTYNESEDPIAPSNTGSQTTETGSSTLVSGPCTIETEITSDNANQTISLGDPIQDIIIDITVGSTCTETLSVSSSNLPEGVTVSLDNNQITVAGTPISNSNGTQITFDYDIMLNIASPTSIISGTIRVENDTSTETNPNQGGGGTDNSDSLGNSIDINSDLNIGTPNDPIYFENGVCKCPGTPVGESYNLAGTLYTVVDDKTIIDQIANENYNLCTTSVSTFFALFEENTSFDSYVGFWDTSNVLDMNRLFNGATQFNQSLSRWNTSKVKYMPNVFSDTETFNQDISNWDTSNVERMDQMFARAKFNQDIGSWEVGNVTLMDNMFDGATQFNQDLSD